MIPELSSARYLADDFPFAIRSERHDRLHAPSWHSHEFIEMVFVEAGEGYHVFEDARYWLSSGDIFLINPGEAHTFDFPDGEWVAIVNCLFLPDILPEPLVRTMVPMDGLDYLYIHPFLHPAERFRRVVNLSGPTREYVRALLRQMLGEWSGFAQTGQAAAELLRLQLMELLLLASSEYGRQPRAEERAVPSPTTEMVRRICGYLELHAAQKTSLDALAARFHLSRRHMERIVRRETGMSVIDHLHNVRIARARRLLEETGDTVGTIAEKVGYEDPAFFSRLFHRQVGVPPGQYRRQERRESWEPRRRGGGMEHHEFPT